MLLRTRLTVIAVALMVVISIVSVVALNIARSNFQERYQADIMAANHSYVKSAVSNIYESLLENAKPLLRSRSFKSAMAGNKADLVAEEIVTIERRLTAGGEISFIQAVGTSGVPLYSASSELSIDLKDPLIGEATTTNTPVSGFTFTNAGQPVLVSVSPVSRRGKAIGTLLIAYDWEKLLNTLAETLGARTALVNGKFIGTSADSGNIWAEIDHAFISNNGVHLLTFDHEDQKFLALVEPYQTIDKKYFSSLVTVLEKTEQLSAESTTTFVMYSVLLIVVGGAVFVIWQQLLKSLRPLSSVIEALGKLGEGDLSLELEPYSRQDEIGSLITAYSSFKEAFVAAQERDQKNKQEQEAQQQEILAATEKRAEAERLQRENEAKEAEARQKTAQAIETLIEGFDTKVHALLENVAVSTGALQDTATSMATLADESEAKAANVATSSEEATHNVTAVANATEELDASISEIGSQMERSAASNKEATEQAKSASVIMQGLESASQAISEVVSLINDIAEQTNLLALNATIEAARAGDAGKGFAVVASEVKSLATQTAKATENISAQITEVQAKSTEASAAMDRIHETVDTSSQLVSGVASALEEQGQATQEIARNVQEAAVGTGQVSSNIVGVSENTVETKKASDRVTDASQALAVGTGEVRDMIEEFLNQVRTISQG